MSRTLSTKRGSGLSLKVSTRWGLSPNSPPDARDRRLTHPRRLGHGPRRPVGGVGRGFLERLDDHRLDVVVTNRARCSGTRFVVQAVEPLGHEALAPLADGGPIDPDALGHFVVVSTSSALEDDAAPKRQCL